MGRSELFKQSPATTGVCGARHTGVKATLPHHLERALRDCLLRLCWNDSLFRTFGNAELHGPFGGDFDRLAAARLDALKAGKLVTFDELASKPKSGQQPEVLAEWWYRNGLNSLWLGNYDSALGYFENAVDKNPTRAEAWIQVGFCKVKQGKNEEAIRAYQQAIRLRPNSYEAYNKLGDAYYYASRYYEAIEAYRRAASLRPDLADAYYNLGMTYLEVGNRAAALAQSRQLQPLDARLYEKLMGEIQR